MDLISIIVPIYNVQSYLPMCLESIVGQTYKNLQIILVDDGSQDDCPQICDEWADKDQRIFVIHKKNGGLSDARNTGLRHARGKYICFVDSDDIVHPKYIEWMHKEMIVNNVKIVACNIQRFSDNEGIEYNIVDYGIAVFKTEEVMKQIIEGTCIQAVAWNKMYLADVLCGEQFEIGKYHEDEFFTYRIIDKVEKVVFVHAKLYFYRQRSGSIMTSFSIRRLDALEAYIGRHKVLKNKYPSLYKQDKITFCVACITYYKMAQERNEGDLKEIENSILNLRKKVDFSLKEILAYSLKDIVYILGSRNLKWYCLVCNRVKRSICEEVN